MYKILKFGVYFGTIASLASCSTSEHFMQDDVYNTRTPIMPPGTDLNDVTDYATFVAKKEQTETPETTTYVSPRQYNDYFYNSQFVYYGYTPYSLVTGIGYAGYTGIYYNPMYGYRSMNMYYGNPYPYGYSSAYYGYGYGSGYTPPYYSGYYYGNSSWYTPASKPSTGRNLSSSSAMVAGGRGSNTAPTGYKHQIMANSNPSGRYERGVINSSARTNSSSPVIVNNNNNRVTPTVNRGQGQASRPVVNNPSTGGTQRSDSYNQRPIVNGNTDRGTRPTVTNSNNNNNTPVRTSTPTIRGGASGGSMPSSGGSRSGGRR